MFWILYSLFWVILLRLNFMCRRFGTLCSIFICVVSRKNVCVCLSVRMEHFNSQWKDYREFRHLRIAWKSVVCFETSAQNSHAEDSPKRKNTTCAWLFKLVMGTVLLLFLEHAVNIFFKQIFLKETYVEAFAMCQYSLDFTFVDGTNHVYCCDR